MPPLTLKRLRAIEEALSSRLAGEIDIEDDADAPAHRDYEAAWYWSIAQIEKREARKKIG